MRFVAKYIGPWQSVVIDVLKKHTFYFDSYDAAKHWAEVANRTPC